MVGHELPLGRKVYFYLIFFTKEIKYVSKDENTVILFYKNNEQLISFTKNRY